MIKMTGATIKHLKGMEIGEINSILSALWMYY